LTVDPAIELIIAASVIDTSATNEPAFTTPDFTAGHDDHVGHNRAAVFDGFCSFFLH
jgi:hypothetical protein